MMTRLVAILLILMGWGLWPIPCVADTWTTELGPYPMTMTLEWVTSARAHVLAEITIPAPRDRVWAVLTDYDHLAEFVPLIEQSRVTQRTSDTLLLYQAGAIRLFFYRRPLTVTFRVQEQPPETITFEAIAGDFRVHRGSWQVRAVPGGTQITYETTIEPAFHMPRWVMGQLERELLKLTFRAIAKRCLTPTP